MSVRCWRLGSLDTSSFHRQDQDYYTPDGDFVPDGDITESTAYDVTSGVPVTVPGQGQNYGWTNDGDLFTVSEDGVLTTCVVAAGDCTEAQLDLDVLPDPQSQEPDTYLVLGGKTYES